MKHLLSRIFSRAFIVAVALLGVNISMAGIFDNSMAFDETPIEFSLGAAKYRIPRNYLFRMSNWAGGPQEYAGIRVVYPGMKPFSKETESCMLHKISCRVYEINLHEKYPTWEDGLANRKEIEHPELGKPGPYGFTLFSEGPENARADFYRKMVDGKPMIFYCLPSNIEGKIYTVCNHAIHASSGITLTYFFDFSEMSRAVEVSENFKKMIDGFAFKGDK